MSLIDTSKKQPRIIDTSTKQPRVDPAKVAKALGAEPTQIKTRRRDPLVILVTKEADGYTYRLHPLQAERVQALRPARHTFRMIFLAQNVQEDFTAVHNPVASHIVELLTGLGLSQINEEGGVSFVKSGSEKVLFTLTSLT